MENWFEFALERYNYWIVIVLMMTGLYIVFARGNLVKKVVGLNLFQTSVFIFYITIGKIVGGTAPIYIGGELDHGGGHGEAGAGHENAKPGEQGALHAAPADHGAQGANALGDHGETSEDLHSKIDNAPVNDMKAALDKLEPASGQTGAEASASLHSGSETAGKIANDALANMPKPDAGGFEIVETGGHHAGEGANALDAAHGAAEAIIYTNPLPHVLILTAIVVGVATTAVGLALAVRIREAYGSIEEDELEAADDIAEFGEVYAAGGAQ